MNDQQIEQQIQAKGLTAPRVTQDQIDALMARVTYLGGRVDQTTSTVVHAFLDGAFLLASGHSACVSPENFDAELGFNMAKAQAENKARAQLWVLEGYALAKKLRVPALDFRDRVRIEAAELDEKIVKLKAFLPTDACHALPEAEQERLSSQLAAMSDYSNVLSERIQAFGG